jgi:hypothetical protein
VLSLNSGLIESTSLESAARRRTDERQAMRAAEL